MVLAKPLEVKTSLGGAPVENSSAYHYVTASGIKLDPVNTDSLLRYMKHENSRTLKEAEKEERKIMGISTPRKNSKLTPVRSIKTDKINLDSFTTDSPLRLSEVKEVNYRLPTFSKSFSQKHFLTRNPFQRIVEDKRELDRESRIV